MPASAMTSASPSFATWTPTAPASSCSRAICGSLCVFVCGRSETPASRGERGDPLDVRAHDVEVEHELRRVRGQLDEARRRGLAERALRSGRSSQGSG